MTKIPKSELDKPTLKEYNQICGDSDEALGNDPDSIPHAIPAGAAGKKEGNIPKMFELSGRAKVKFVANYIEEMLNNNVKFLLFGHHKFVLDELQGKLQNLNCEHIRIDGGTPMEARQELVKTFQTKASCKVALLSITACGMGLTLTEASHVVFAEYYWVPGQLMQAEDRAHRIGQKNAVTIEYMTAEGTADPKMFRMVNRKAKECSTSRNNRTANNNAKI